MEETHGAIAACTIDQHTQMGTGAEPAVASQLWRNGRITPDVR
jgi:hypothetical protein